MLQNIMKITSIVIACAFFAQPAMAQFLGFQKISDTSGGFTAHLEDGDDFGESVTGLGDLDLDGVPDIAISAEDDDDGGTDRGAVYILFLNPDGTVKSHQKISQTVGGFTGELSDSDEFGNTIVNLGDIDGDGVVDLAVNAVHDDDGGNNRGAVWILFLHRNGTVKGHQKISSTSGGFSGVLNNYDCFACSLEVLGDLDGNGIPDLAAGAQHDDDGGKNHGAVWILFLNSDGTVKAHQKISSTAGGFTGHLDENDQFSQAIANMGDLDGDGVIDIAVSADKDDDGVENSGAVWLLFLNSDGTVKRHQKISRTEGGFTGDLQSNEDFGQSVEGLGDLDGDGIAELAVGQEFSNYGPNHHRGAFWILYLNADSTVKSYQKIDTYTPEFANQLDNGDEFGQDITKIGDLNGDGVVDIVVTADADDDGGDHRGAAYIFFLEGTPIPDDGNHAPVLSSIGSRSVVEDQLIKISLSASDIDNDSILLEVSSMPPGADFTDHGDGTGTFTWIPAIGSSANSPYTVLFRASDPSGASDIELVSITVSSVLNGGGFLQHDDAQGVVSIEAENYHRNISQSGHNWVLRGDSNAAGSAGMRAEPENRTIIKTGYDTISPRMDYDIEFVKTGTHYVWVRGYGKNSGADSVHAGFDGNPIASASSIVSFNPDKTWVWENNTKSGARATIDVSTAGMHTLNLWMREDGFFLDKIVLTTDPSFVPAEFGPPQSPSGSGDNQPPILDAIGNQNIIEEQLLEINISATDPEGSTILLEASSLPPGAELFDNGDSTGVFSWLPSIGTAVNSPYFVTFKASDPRGASDSEEVKITVNSATSTSGFQQSDGADGLVSMEAENFHRNISKGDHSWILRTDPDVSGAGGMRSEPDSGTNIKTNFISLSPQLDFDITFLKSGTHYVWVRGYAEGSGADSVHIGFDGLAVQSATAIASFNPDRNWVWESRTKRGVRATINVTPGQHTLNLWMREDGFFVDKIVLTTDPTFVPSDLGPVESPR